MPNCDFYATIDDHAGLLTWLFEEKSCEVYELASRFEQPLRRFFSAKDVLAVFAERYDIGEKLRTVDLQLSVLGAGPPLVPRRIPLNPEACGGARFRYAAEGWGLVQLYLGTVWRGKLEKSHTNHNSQKRAEAWAPILKQAHETGEWDFKRIQSFSSRLNREIRKRAVAKLGSRPVLAGARTLWHSGVDFYEIPRDSLQMP